MGVPSFSKTQVIENVSAAKPRFCVANPQRAGMPVYGQTTMRHDSRKNVLAVCVTVTAMRVFAAGGNAQSPSAGHQGAVDQ